METASSDLAFPVFDSTGRYNPGSCGLTKREYFAAIAMQGLLASDTIPDESRWTFEGCAAAALDHADALIAALNREIPE